MRARFAAPLPQEILGAVVVIAAIGVVLSLELRF
jgi:hypothetical protein